MHYNISVVCTVQRHSIIKSSQYKVGIEVMPVQLILTTFNFCTCWTKSAIKLCRQYSLHLYDLWALTLSQTNVLS